MTTAITKCSLICDDRERSVIAHSIEFANISYSVGRVTTGDYAIIGPDKRLLAIIERKSLDDYGASIKDSRHANKEKLAAVSAKTGCRIIYIIEGPLSPKLNDQFARIPYKHIESSIHHLIVRDNICVLRTKDTLDTAQTLARFVRNCDTLIRDDILPDTTISSGSEVQGDSPQNNIDVLEMLSEKHIKADIDIVRAMWACFRGISVTSADQYINLMSLGDLICGHIDINNLKLNNGKTPPKRAFEALKNIDSDLEIKLIATLPGFSRICAAEIIKKYRLATLLTFPEGAISIITVKGKTAERKLGMDKAKKILKYFNFTNKVQTL